MRKAFVGPCFSVHRKGLNGATLSLHSMMEKRANLSSFQPTPTSLALTAAPAQGRPIKSEMSSSMGAISPHGRWNVCVLGCHLSTRAVRRAQS